MVYFTVRLVVVEEMLDLNSFVVILYENKDGSGKHIEFQRALSFDEQDIRSGMNTYCTVTGDGATHYGGVNGWGISDTTLALQLETEAAVALGMEQEFHVALELNEASLSRLMSGLTRVFEMQPNQIEKLH